jgi:hypothetical protein
MFCVAARGETGPRSQRARESRLLRQVQLCHLLGLHRGGVRRSTLQAATAQQPGRRGRQMALAAVPASQQYGRARPASTS